MWTAVGSFGSRRVRLGDVHGTPDGVRIATGLSASRLDDDFGYLDREATLDAGRDVFTTRQNAGHAAVAGLASVAIPVRVGASSGGALTITGLAQARRQELPGSHRVPTTYQRLDSSRLVSALELTVPVREGTFGVRAWGRREELSLKDSPISVRSTFNPTHTDDAIIAAGGSAGWRARPTESTNVELRVDGSAERFAPGTWIGGTAPPPGARRTNGGVAIDASTLVASTMTIAASARGDMWVDTADDGTSATEERPTGNLGVELPIGPLIVASHGGFVARPPSFLERYGNRGAFIGDPRLKPESAFTADAGARATRRLGPVRVHAEAAGFATWAEDLITFVYAGANGRAKATNIGRARLFGIESELRLAAFGFEARASHTALATANESECRFEGTTCIRPPLPGRPAHDFIGDLSWTRGPVRLRYGVDAVAGILADVTANIEVPLRVFHGAGVRVAVPQVPGLSLTLDVRNIFDFRVVEYPGALGRVRAPAGDSVRLSAPRSSRPSQRSLDDGRLQVTELGPASALARLAAPGEERGQRGRARGSGDLRRGRRRRPRALLSLPARSTTYNAPTPVSRPSQSERDARRRRKGEAAFRCGPRARRAKREARRSVSSIAFRATVRALPMSQSTPPPNPQTPNAAGGPPEGEGAVAIQGGAAILAPITAFPNGVPGNALVLIPLGPNGHAGREEDRRGPRRAEDGGGLEAPRIQRPRGAGAGRAGPPHRDRPRGSARRSREALERERRRSESRPHLRSGADEVRPPREGREAVLAKIVALGGDGEDWLGLGVAQLAQKKLDKAEATLKGAQNLLKDSPFPSLQLAKVFKAKKDAKAERESVERGDPDRQQLGRRLGLPRQRHQGERRRGEGDGADRGARERAGQRQVRGAVRRAPGLLREDDEKTRDKAIGFAKKAVERAPGDPLALLVLSALYGQAGKIDEVVKLLAPHEALMQGDVRLAHNYFEALFQSKDMQKITALLNKLATQSDQGGQAVRDRADARHLADAPAAAAGASGCRSREVSVFDVSPGERGLLLQEPRSSRISTRAERPPLRVVGWGASAAGGWGASPTLPREVARARPSLAAHVLDPAGGAPSARSFSGPRVGDALRL